MKKFEEKLIDNIDQRISDKVSRINIYNRTKIVVKFQIKLNKPEKKQRIRIIVNLLIIIIRKL